MALSSGSSIESFDSQVEVTEQTTGSVASNAFSVSGDVNAFVNSDDAPLFSAVLAVQFATMPTAGQRIGLFARPLGVSGANDAPVPSSNYLETYMGSFKIDDGGTINTTMYLPLAGLKLPNVKSGQSFEFYIKNNSSQAITAGWALFVTPVSYKAKS
ncbi:MAG: hypothetical protein IBX56_00110 [Methylomicrobium sp.]|nr:hypothetical protein [Methylomicrobium sp.]